MINVRLATRALAVSVAALFSALFVGVAAAPALADATYNNVEINISGGNANALSACVNYAKLKAQKGQPAQSNACKNFAKASGGDGSPGGRPRRHAPW